MAKAALRRMLVESPNSLGARARARRWQMVRDVFPDMSELRLLDLGGTVESWRRAPVRPSHVTVLNLFEPGDSGEDWLHPVTGDACRATETLAAAGVHDTFDVVFSNSLLEHVGGHARRADLADEIIKLAPRHWVQTPYRYFPLEPHWLFPGMQFLPVAARARIAASWPLTHTKPKDMDDARTSVLWTELVSATEMKSYFPTSEIRHERVAGVTKSLIAIR